MEHNYNYDVAIAGAGIVGASVAWHLAKAGLRVVVIDQTGPAAAASGASDGAISVASKVQGPIARLASASLLYTEELARAGLLLKAFKRRPSYIFATSVEEITALDNLIVKLQALAGPVRVVSDGSAKMLTGLSEQVERLITLEGEGHMPGHQAVLAYLTTPGITPLWPSNIKSINSDSTGVTVDLGTQNLRVGYLVAALGVSTPSLFPTMPILPRAGQLIVTDRGPVGGLQGSLTAAAYLLAKTEISVKSLQPPVVIDPLGTGQYLIGSSRENHGDSTKVDFETVRLLLTRASAVWPALRAQRVIRAFSGVRAAVSDGMPIVGPLPDAKRIIMATGFEGDGICLSALIGREVALMVRDVASQSEFATDLAALSPARFLSARQEGVA